MGRYHRHMTRSRYWLAAALLLSTACSPSVVSDADVAGIWILESFSANGSFQDVEVGVNTAQQPWVEFGDTVKGEAGCNRFGAQSIEWSDGRLIANEVHSTLVYCGLDDDSLMQTEFALKDALAEREDGVEVEIDGDEMIWRADDIELFFRSSPTPPVPPTRPPPQAMGELDCSPGHIIEETIDDSTRDTEWILRDEVPEVVRTEEDLEFAPPSPEGWFWLGYDIDDTLIAFIARGDIEPPRYQLFTCSEQ